MPRLPLLSGREVIAALERLGFERMSQRGSHVKLRKHLVEGKRVVVVPDHHELAVGTLVAILRQAGISREDLIANLE